MRLQKTYAALALSALVLAGCSGGGTSEPSEPAEGGADDGLAEEDGGEFSGDLEFATWQFLEPNRGDDIYDAINAYTEENSDVSLSKLEVARADYEKTLSTQFGAGAGPDIFVIPDAFYPQLVEAGILEPLDSVVEGVAGFRDINENYATDGTQYAVAWEVVPYALYWNMDIVGDDFTAPTDLDSLVETITTVADESGKTAFTVRHQMNEETPWWTDFSNWIFGYGGAWSDGENLTIDSAENIAALEAFQNVTSTTGFGLGQDASTYRSAFAAGELAMAIDNSSAVLTQVSEDVAADRIGAAVLPFPAGGSAFAGFSVGVNANSDNKDAAVDWIRWFLQEDAQSDFADALFPSAIATDAAASADLVDANPWVDAFFEQINNASSVIIEGYEEETSEIRTIVLTEIARVVSEGADPAEALGKAQAAAEALVN